MSVVHLILKRAHTLHIRLSSCCSFIKSSRTYQSMCVFVCMLRVWMFFSLILLLFFSCCSYYLLLLLLYALHLMRKILRYMTWWNSRPSNRTNATKASKKKTHTLVDNWKLPIERWTKWEISINISTNSTKYWKQKGKATIL